MPSNSPLLDALALEYAAKASQINEPIAPYHYAIAQVGSMHVVIVVTDATAEIKPLDLMLMASGGSHPSTTPAMPLPPKSAPHHEVFLSNKDKKIVDLIREHKAMSTRQLSNALGLVPGSSTLRGRLANLTAQRILLCDSQDGYMLGPNAPGNQQLSG